MSFRHYIQCHFERRKPQPRNLPDYKNVISTERSERRPPPGYRNVISTVASATSETEKSPRL